jgi:hypothetical protein
MCWFMTSDFQRCLDWRAIGGLVPTICGVSRCGGSKITTPCTTTNNTNKKYIDEDAYTAYVILCGEKVFDKTSGEEGA